MRRLALLLIAGLALPGATAAQDRDDPPYAVIEIADAPDGYLAWFAWDPFVLPTQDGGAWAFFTAEVRLADGLGSKRLYAARFDPDERAWQPAEAVPGGAVQFGPTAVEDRDGVVHLVFSDRTEDAPEVFSTLLYVRSDGRGGWTDPVPVAPHPDAGHQLSPDMALDGRGKAHLVWQDQRAYDAEARAASVANADIFCSDLRSDGRWSRPVPVNRRPDRSSPAHRPHLAVDGERLVAVWSVYQVDTGLQTAARLEWGERTRADPQSWSESRLLVERRSGELGGRLVDLASDPRGGAALVYARNSGSYQEMLLRRLGPGAAEWERDIRLADGDRGAYPAIAIGPDGTAYVAYHAGPPETVQVAAVAVEAGAERPSRETVLTRRERMEDGGQGIPAIAADRDGAVWLCYFREPFGAPADQVRCLSGADLTP